MKDNFEQHVIWISILLSILNLMWFTGILEKLIPEPWLFLVVLLIDVPCVVYLFLHITNRNTR